MFCGPETAEGHMRAVKKYFKFLRRTMVPQIIKTCTFV